MKFEEIINNIKLIKEQRAYFMNNFKNNYKYVYDSLIAAVDNNNLNTIRVHKFLTENNKLGKVKTSRFLEEIGLNENTKIYELSSSLIEKIANYSEE
tara:strand:+ start:2771 stop:3061 length:291 start_codon:yes stop_codon:yes gene_type:complete